MKKIITSIKQMRSLVREDKGGTQELEEYA